MTINLDAMKQIVQALYATMVVEEHGAEGAKILGDLLAGIRIIYQHLDPDAVAGRIAIFKMMEGQASNIPAGSNVRRPESLPQDAHGPVLIEVLDNGAFTLWNQNTSNLALLAANAVVYEYVAANETFYAKSKKKTVPKLDRTYSSVFAVPTFSDLREALDVYRTKLARMSTCEILSTAWYDGNRLFLKAKPEVFMRKSLTQFLHSTLRGAEVRPEQIVDESHPVDIKVTWLFTNRLGLIEIKWLGDSKNSKGETSTKYRDARALSGAKQLAEYLDSNRKRAPDHMTRGYLTVFDARRNGLADGTSTITHADGMHYETLAIEYAPEFHKTREDFEEPVRFFVEPECV